MQYLYLTVAIISICGLLVADYRYKLALFRYPRRRILLLVGGVLFFLIWDIAGIVLNIFYTRPEWVSGWYIVTPNLPVEEIAFLTLLVYQVVLLWEVLCIRTRS